MQGRRLSAGIILSGAYISQSMISEFGYLPPSFLPLANCRLYCRQIESLKDIASTITLVLPQDFEMEEYDRDWLYNHQINLCYVDANKTLGYSLRHCLSGLEQDIEDVRIIFGDTLITDLISLPAESVVVGREQEYSHWGYCKVNNQNNIEYYENTGNINISDSVIAGGFRLSKSCLENCLKLSGDDFIAAMNLYSTQRIVKLVEIAGKWHDFGHINSYFRSRRNFTTERSFNNLHIKDRSVNKYSIDTKKIAAEISWFENVPLYLNVFLPKYLGKLHDNRVTGYTTEYIFLPNVNDLFVYGRMPIYVWQQIFNSCCEFLTVCKKYGDPDKSNADFQWLYSVKTKERMSEFSKQRNLSLDHDWIYNGEAFPSLRKIFQTVLSQVRETNRNHISIMHGDFHFANMFFDFRSFSIKTVDPRGMVDDTITVYGDYRYDIAKLAHSVYGLYDFIIAGALQAVVKKDYEIEFHIETNPYIQEIQKAFGAMKFNGVSPCEVEIGSIVILLFLSMLPLHNDDHKKQNTLLANVFRLYAEMQNFYKKDDQEL
jgi:hypothetical protein